MSKVYTFQSRNATIGPVALYILEKFVERSEYSAYKMWLALKNSPIKMEYKNVHMRFQRLRKLNLIRQDETKDAGRGAIYYKLTSEGLFYFLQHWDSAFVIFLGPQLFLNYGKDVAFETLLYPYISYTAVKRLKSVEIFIRLLEYLRECCNEINRLLNRMEEVGAGFNTYVPMATNPNKKIHYATVKGDSLEYTIKMRFVKHLIYDLVSFPSYFKANATDLSVLVNSDNFSMFVGEMKNQFNDGYSKLMSLRKN